MNDAMIHIFDPNAERSPGLYFRVFFPVMGSDGH